MTVLIRGTLRIKADKLDQVTVAAVAMSEASEAEDGCVDYRFAADLSDPLVVYVIEEWADQASLDAHLAAPHFAQFAATLGDWLDGAPELVRYEVASQGPLLG